MAMIQEIDKDQNGYVTSTELDDILKIIYPKDLGDKNLKHILKPFCSSANKVLLDYKQFRKFIVENINNNDVTSAFGSIGKKQEKPNLKNLQLDPTKKNASF